MFTVRTESGLRFHHTEMGDKYNKEIEHDTIEEAETRIEFYRMMSPDEQYYVHEVSPGRPPIGVTRKVSLTLTEEDWARFDERADGNRSKYLRSVLTDALDGRTDKEQIAKQLLAYMESLYDQSQQEKPKDPARANDLLRESIGVNRSINIVRNGHPHKH